MTDQPKTALDQFLAAAKRIEGIRGESNSARALINIAIRDVECVTIRADSQFYNRTPAADTEAAAKRIREMVKAEAVASAERERDAKLSALAAELQAIRATLSSLAAQAAIELGHQARMLAYEANGAAP